MVEIRTRVEEEKEEEEEKGEEKGEGQEETRDVDDGWMCKVDYH